MIEKNATDVEYRRHARPEDVSQWDVEAIEVGLDAGLEAGWLAAIETAAQQAEHILTADGLLIAKRIRALKPLSRRRP